MLASAPAVHSLGFATTPEKYQIKSTFGSARAMDNLNMKSLQQTKTQMALSP